MFPCVAALQTFDVIRYERLIDHYLVLTHAVTRVKNDPLAHHYVFVWRVVVKTVAGLAPVLQLQRFKKTAESAQTIQRTEVQRQVRKSKLEFTKKEIRKFVLKI